MKRYLSTVGALVALITVLAVAQTQLPLGPFGTVPINRVDNVATDTATIVANKTVGLLTGTPTAAAAYTTDTAANICKVFPFVANQNAFGFNYIFYLKNTAGGAFTITLTAGAGVTIVGTATVAQNNIKPFLVVLKTCTVGSEAVDMISLGTSAF
jgi:hypothetical protein